MRWSTRPICRRPTRISAALALTALAAIGAAAQALLFVPPAQAQTWPQRNVRFILPFGAGSATDSAARLLSDRLSARWGQPVIIDNRPGGDGLVAMSAFVTAADDHTLLFASTASFIAHPYTHEKLPYNLERDLQPIARLSHTLLTVSVPEATPLKSLAEFVAIVRAEPGKLNVAGAPGLPEFTLEAFLKTKDLKVTKVPYRDIVQAGRDLAENRIQLLVASHAVSRPLVEAGKIRVIAIGNRARTVLMPDVPTVVEAGFSELVVETTSGFYGPSGMPIELRERLAADIIAVAQDPTISQRITLTGQAMDPAGPDELAATVKQQAATTATIATVLGMTRKN
jgi:tripartite-type tricarboxylate transporter receptor subunit TctC